MIKDRIILAPVAALLLCFLGMAVLVGWMTSSPALVRIVPGSVAMSINTAFMFTVVGVAFALHARGRGNGVLATSAAALLIILPSLILLEHIFDVDLGIDLAHVHQRLGDGHAKPGRTAPNACVAFLLAGVWLTCVRRLPPGRWGPSFLQMSGLLVLLIGLTAFIGYLLRLDVMYQVATFNRMAVFTALGITVMGAGLLGLMPADAGQPHGLGEDARRITKLAAGLLIAFAISTGLLSFVVLRGSYESAASEYHQGSASTLALTVESQFRQASLLSASLARRPTLAAALQAVAANGTSGEPMLLLLRSTTIFESMGFRAVSIRVADGREVFRHGVFGASSRAVVSPATTEGDQHGLHWQGGYFVRGEHRIEQAGKLLAVITTERALPDLDASVAQAYRASATTDVLICHRAGNTMECFPSRFYTTAPAWPLLKDGKPNLPMSRALLGESGATNVKDPRGRAVLAAYSPISSLAMGVVVKTEVRELYMPLRNQMHVLLGGMLLFVVLGVLLLRRWLQPLIAGIIGERQRISAILNNANDAFIGIGNDGMVSDWNKQAERTFGIAAADAIGADLAELIIPESMRAAHNEGFARFRHTGHGAAINNRVEVSAVHADGHILPVELSVTAFQVGSGYGASAFVRDLSERKRAEEQEAEHARALEEARMALAQSQKLEAVGKLTGGIAHDFNNVLQVVGGSLELLIHDGVSDQRVLRRVDTAMGAVERGARLASHLLAFARRQPLQPQPVNLARIVRDMADMLQRAIGDEIDIEMISGAGLWNTLVDPHQLEQVVLNLAINARDAMEGRGQLTIELANADLDEAYVSQVPGLAPGQFVLLAVSDTGCGMSAATMEKAFEPFFSTKPEGQGTGLGLSMTYGFVKQSQGHIKMYSELGHGTTIRIYLPRSHAAEQAPDRHVPQAVHGGDETILVVEDDPSVQRTAVEQLQRLGYQVYSADNADAAMKLIENGLAIDLLFTDVVMPGTLRSPELARRAVAMLPRLKVLFTSGYTQNAIVHGGRLDPGVHLLSKPYSREKLASKVRSLLAEPGPAVINSGLRVAFVEDNDDFRMLGRELLGMLGHVVEEFADAESALAALQPGRFDVLLTDVGLPGISGLVLAERARQLDPRLHIVIASGYGDSVNTNVGLQLPVLTKPFTIEQLAQCLQR